MDSVLHKLDSGQHSFRILRYPSFICYFSYEFPITPNLLATEIEVVLADKFTPSSHH